MVAGGRRKTAQGGVSGKQRGQACAMGRISGKISGNSKFEILPFVRLGAVGPAHQEGEGGSRARSSGRGASSWVDGVSSGLPGLEKKKKPEGTRGPGFNVAAAIERRARRGGLGGQLVCVAGGVRSARLKRPLSYPESPS